VIVHIVDVIGIDDHHCLNYLFIIKYTFIYQDGSTLFFPSPRRVKQFTSRGNFGWLHPGIISIYIFFITSNRRITFSIFSAN